MTRHRFIRLELFQDHMMSLDAEGDKIRSQFNRNSDKIFQYYRKEWAHTLKRSSQAMRVGDRQGPAVTKMPGGKKRSMPNGPLYPYKPHTDRGYGHQFSEYDVLWTTSLLTHPGK